MWSLVCYDFFGFEFCCKIWVLLWVLLGFFFFLNFLDLSFIVVGLAGFFFFFLGFKFYGKILVLLLRLLLGLGMAKIGADLRLEREI